MENSILTSTKQIIGLNEDYTAFDLDIITHINSAFSTLNQLGVGAVNGFMIEDKNAEWADLLLPMNQENMVRTLVYLKVKLTFDPPATSFAIAAMEKQIAEQEWRLNAAREEAKHIAEEVA